jgi:hypothetical protein
MHRSWLPVLAVVSASMLGGCGSVTLPSLAGAPASTAPGPAPEAVRQSGSPSGAPNAFETAFMAQGTPTAIYTLVARGALNCWLGAAGPLHETHVFSAEATPPNQGGAAEIVLHERDASLRDQRGPRALRIKFENVQGSVRVGISNLRLGVALAQAMASDAAQWAKGGTGCQAQAVREPPIVTGWERQNLPRQGRN